MKTIEMPKMGDTMEEGKIIRWLKQVGDTVKKGEPVAEIETDKVSIEIESYSSGILRKILVPEGEAAPIGAGIALVGTADEPLPGDGATATSPNLPAQASSTNGHTSAPVAVQVASPLVSVTIPQEGVANQGRIFISPIARRLAQEYQIDYTKIQGTGPNNRIIKMDVEAALAARQQAAPVAPVMEAIPVTPTIQPAPVAEPVAAPVQTDADVIEIPLTSMRRTIARRLSQSMQTAPHIYLTIAIDTGKLAQLRQQINEYAAKESDPVKVSYNDLIIKAVAQALTRVPEVNVSFAEDRLLQKKQINIGNAVALEGGLIVPVVRNADKRTVLDLAHEAHRLTGLAQSGKLRPEDLSGGTFTVSNLGMFGIEQFTAVINPPEAAILAVGAITPTPVVENGQVVVRDQVKVTLSADHRAIDGALAARFLQVLKGLLEEPFGLLL